MVISSWDEEFANGDALHYTLSFASKARFTNPKFEGKNEIAYDPDDSTIEEFHRSATPGTYVKFPPLQRFEKNTPRLQFTLTGPIPWNYPDKFKELWETWHKEDLAGVNHALAIRMDAKKAGALSKSLGYPVLYDSGNTHCYTMLKNMHTYITGESPPDVKSAAAQQEWIDAYHKNLDVVAKNHREDNPEAAQNHVDDVQRALGNEVRSPEEVERDSAAEQAEVQAAYEAHEELKNNDAALPNDLTVIKSLADLDRVLRKYLELWRPNVRKLFLDAIVKDQTDANGNLYCARCKCTTFSCGVKLVAAFLEIDHILAVALGGGHRRPNLQGLCPCCHKVKTVQEDLPAIYASKCHPCKKRARE